MASQIDFVIAAGLFIIFTATIITILLNYLTNYFNITSIADLRTVAYDTFYSIFSNAGIPANWENTSYVPLRLGLITNLYEVPFVVNETNGTVRNSWTINTSFAFDTACQNKAWNTTVRIYDSDGVVVPLNIFNSSFCTSQYLKTADVVFNVTLAAYKSQNFFIYYSSQQKILPDSASYTYPNVTKYTVTKYPEITMQAVSVDKLLALRNLSYDQVEQTLSTNFNYYFEVGK